jgi:DNA polymerase III delta subunit
VFVTPKLDKKLKWVKWLLSQPQVTHEVFDPLPFWEVGKAVDQLLVLATQQHIKLDRQAATQLIDAHGMDFFALSQAIEQAHVFAKGQPVTPTHIQAFLPANDNVFDALMAWVQQHQPTENRWQVLHKVMQTDAPLRLLGLTQKMLNDYWLVSSMMRSGHQADSIAPLVGKKPGWVFNVWKWLQHVPPERLVDLRLGAIETDWAIKRGDLAPQLALEVLWSR